MNKKMNETENVFKKTITITWVTEDKEHGLCVLSAFCHEDSKHISGGAFLNSNFIFVKGHTYEVTGRPSNLFSFEILSERMVETRLLPVSVTNALSETSLGHLISFANSQIIKASKSGALEAVILGMKDYHSPYNKKLLHLLKSNGYKINNVKCESNSIRISWDPAFDELYELGELPPIVSPHKSNGAEE